MSASSVTRLGSAIFVLATGSVLAVAVGGCNQKDAAACEQGLQVTQQAIDRQNFSSAEQWREYAWKHCDDRAALESLDQKLVAKRGEVEAQKRAAEERSRNKTALLKTFLTWVAENRTAPDKASATQVCDPPALNDPKKDQSKERLCTATRVAGTYQLVARYWQAEPILARFSVPLPDVATCAEIGAPNILKTWQVPATGGRSTARHRCEFSAGPLSGLNAVVSDAVNADIYVFNPGYLEKDPAQRHVIEGP